MPKSHEVRRIQFRQDVEPFRVLQKANLLGELDGYRVRGQVGFSRASAVSGFTGIMLAGDLVFLSAAPDTLLGIAKYQWFWVGGSALAAGAMLAIAAVCSLLSFEFRSRRIMETDGEVLLQKYKENLDHRESWSNFAAWLAVLGTILMVGSVGWAVLAKLLK